MPLKKYFYMYVVCILLGSCLCLCGCRKDALTVEEIKATQKKELNNEKESSKKEKEEKKQQDKEKQDKEKPSKKSEESLVVFVCGAVKKEGVYELPVGSRICDAIKKAEGMTAEAGTTFLNQAQMLEDGQQIYVPTKEEEHVMETSKAAGWLTEDEKGSESSGKININTASKEELMTLSGIGDSKAEAILNWRKEHGSFSAIEELMEISGIKEGVFNKIKDQITVT